MGYSFIKPFISALRFSCVCRPLLRKLPVPNKGKSVSIAFDCSFAVFEFAYL